MTPSIVPSTSRIAFDGLHERDQLLLVEHPVVPRSLRAGCQHLVDALHRCQLRLDQFVAHQPLVLGFRFVVVGVDDGEQPHEQHPFVAVG